MWYWLIGGGEFITELFVLEVVNDTVDDWDGDLNEWDTVGDKSMNLLAYLWDVWEARSDECSSLLLFT